MTKLTREEIFAAADNLSRGGGTPTQDHVRAACGNRGSMSTVNTYLREWRERQEAAARLLGTELSPQLQHQATLWIAGLHREIRQSFEEVSARQAADAARREAALIEDRAVALTEADELQSQISDLSSRAQAVQAELATTQVLLVEKQQLIGDMTARAVADKMLIASLKDALMAQPRPAVAAKHVHPWQRALARRVRKTSAATGS